MSLNFIPFTFSAVWLFVVGALGFVFVCSYSGMLIFATYYDCDPLTTKVWHSNRLLFLWFSVTIIINTFFTVNTAKWFIIDTTCQPYIFWTIKPVAMSIKHNLYFSAIKPSYMYTLWPLVHHCQLYIRKYKGKTSHLWPMFAQVWDTSLDTNLRNVSYKDHLFFPCGAATQHGSWSPHSWGFYITHNNTPQSVGLLWTSDQLVT